MRDLRVYSPTENKSPKELILSASESHHLVSVNRARSGDLVVAFDGEGREWECRLEEASKNAARLHVITPLKVVTFPYRITLAQALPKGATMDDIVRRATEIGAARVIPLLSERSQVHLDDARQEKKREKWRVAALEAAKQCGNPWVPEIAHTEKADEFIRGAEMFDLKLIASLHEGAQSLKSILDEHVATKGSAPRELLWMVGPEGDFSPEEMALAVEREFRPVTLGPLVLRSETAAVYALSILSYELANRV